MVRTADRRYDRSALIAFALLVGFMAALMLSPKQAWAETAGAFEVTGGTKGVDWTYETLAGQEDTNIVRVQNGANVTISMAAGKDTATEDGIAVADGAHAAITLDSVKISYAGYSKVLAIGMSTGVLDLTLKGTSSITGPGSETPVLVPNGSTLNVTKASTGTLTVTAPGGAGIGGGNATSTGAISISGGTLNVTGGRGAAIGNLSGNSGDGRITISGGTVVANGYNSALGGWTAATKGAITITGGNVTATSQHAAAIGDMNSGAVGTITISGGTVKATSNSSAAGIGAAYQSSSGGEITISGGDVTAQGSSSAGIGSATRSPQGKIRITGGTVHAKAGRGAGIGAGLDSTGDTDITISDSDVTATGVSGAGIGTGTGDSHAIITISNATVHADSNAGSGIGDGYGGTGNVDITISKSTIVASGYNGAGVGGWSSGNKGNVSITGGDVTATSMSGAAGIGGGYDGGAGTILIKGATVRATAINGACGIGAGSTGFDDTSSITLDDAQVSAKGSGSGAAIGLMPSLVDNKASAVISITGGKIIAVGDENGGGGICCSSGGSADGKITISNSDVTSKGATSSAGIGGGAYSPAGDIQITNSTVVSVSGYGAGIGGGERGGKGTIHITGGDITATGGSGAGIGGGATEPADSVGAIVLDQTKVTATGSDQQPGIGGGSESTGGSITVTGGQIIATGGAGGSGIGSGAGGFGAVIVIKSGVVTGTGGAKAPGIGSRARANSTGKVSISGGSILAVPGEGSKAIDSDAISITGGIYGKGAAAELPGTDTGRAYEWAPDQGYVALDNVEGATKGTYPIRIYRLKTYGLSGKTELEKVYDGAAPDVGLFALSDGDQGIPGFDGLVASARFRYRAGDGDWADGLPKDAGTYSTEATVGIARDDTAYIAYAPTGPLETKLTIDRKPIEISSATVASKDWDGKRDATLDSVEFKGLIDGEALATPQDYTATALFDDAEAGTGKSVIVTADLVENGPVAKNYILADGKGTFKTTADIRPTGGGDDHGGDDHGGNNNGGGDHGGNSNGGNGNGANSGTRDGRGPSSGSGRNGSRGARGSLASTGDIAGFSSFIALAAGAGAIGLAAAFRRRTER
ncbi:hypothetical protein Corgl_1433 [Coriobacterium glomerans PW2]|uniref:YDG domain-containing protein n=1 Tax=Coriobacterium glomerans (strain ATCC 49209 / DSM 20642 / JCM 10262 / PW2) TaxID=700015 RepID=F2NAS7_CORGP|nr:YDG domain-containing protein [Coriobacterium glomerans]AEB07533.1 hypothetical protein Corgl_1433 [Coriobacterium glomerans PW2]